MTIHAMFPIRTWFAAMTITLMAIVPVRSGAQISPGPLAKAHAGLEGAANCAKCHGLRREPMSQLCLECHREVRWGIEQGSGLHAREMRQTRKECANCHPDHAGVTFALIAWSEGSPSRFDHKRAGWALDGKHANAKCESCHKAEFRVSQAAALSNRKSDAGWLGLETRCAACHRNDDVHRNALGSTCDNCHDAAGWKPAPRFDHARTVYPLTDKHVNVECAKCHLAPRLAIKPNGKGERVPLFKPVPFGECSSCHADPHKGQLSAKCSGCHVTRGFSAINKSEFNHAGTNYPLTGKHRSVSCEACHGVKLAKPKPAFSTCGGCHADAHRGEATLAGKPADCSACHQVQGFVPSTYTVAQHSSAVFPLGGKHKQVKCSSCHTVIAANTSSVAHETRNVRIRMASAMCANCHADAHGGQLGQWPERGTCERCHTDTAWKPSTYTIAAHATLRVSLEGRHGAIPCAACHALSRPGLPTLTRTDALGTAHVLLKVPEMECVSCHVDPHAGRHAEESAFAAANGCRSCHDWRSFRPSLVDVAAHTHFSFALEGGHRAAPCVACHAEMKAARATSTLTQSAKGVAPLPFATRGSATCGSCHRDPHGTQFAARKDRGACEVCHGVDVFAPATRFDHERDAAFSLKGAHVKVACAGCHRAATAPNATKFVVYRGLSGKCESCHAGKLPGGFK